MNITTAQRFKILQLWGKVCAARGWKASDRALRLTTLGGFLGRELSSTDAIERLAECTKVMAELEALLGTSVRAGLEATDPARNRKRNWRWLIERELLPCLALYPLDAPMAATGARAYLGTVLTSKTRWRKTDRPESDPTLADFDERTVQQIFWTLSARLNSLRKAAGHTGHAMRLAAGVRCQCAACSKSAARPIVPPLAPTDRAAESVDVLVQEDPDWTV